MNFLCKWVKRDDPKTFAYKTVWADSVNDATRQAKWYTKNGYILLSVIEKRK